MTTVRPIAALDVPLPVVEADASFLWAAEHTADPSEQLAYRLDAKFVRHPELLATDDSYPGWAEHIAAREADNRTTRKEGTS